MLPLVARAVVCVVADGVDAVAGRGVGAGVLTDAVVVAAAGLGGGGAGVVATGVFAVDPVVVTPGPPEVITSSPLGDVPPAPAMVAVSFGPAFATVVLGGGEVVI
jgi:hypothetical protein